MSNAITTKLRRISPAAQLPAAPVRLPRINLLPPSITVQRTRRQVLSGLAAAGIFAVIAILLLTMLAASRRASEQRRLDAAQQRNAQLQQEAASYANVRQAYSDVDRARATLRSALSTEVRYSRLLVGLSAHVPATIQVTTVTYAQTGSAAAAAPSASGTGAVAPAPTAVAGSTVVGSTPIGTVAIGGLTASHDDVATWLQALAKQTGITDTAFTTSTKADRNGQPVITFQSTAVITAAALSGRYAGADGGLR